MTVSGQIVRGSRGEGGAVRGKQLSQLTADVHHPVRLSCQGADDGLLQGQGPGGQPRKSHR